MNGTSCRGNRDSGCHKFKLLNPNCFACEYCGETRSVLSFKQMFDLLEAGAKITLVVNVEQEEG